MISGLGKGASAASHAAVVGVKHGKAMLGQQLIKEQAVAPAICDGLHVGTAIGIHYEGHAGGTGGAFGQQQSGVEGCAVVGLYLKLPRGAEPVGVQRARLPEGVTLAGCLAEAQGGRIEARGLFVGKRAAGGSKGTLMMPGAGA